MTRSMEIDGVTYEGLISSTRRSSRSAHVSCSPCARDASDLFTVVHGCSCGVIGSVRFHLANSHGLSVCGGHSEGPAVRC